VLSFTATISLFKDDLKVLNYILFIGNWGVERTLTISRMRCTTTDVQKYSRSNWLMFEKAT